MKMIGENTMRKHFVALCAVVAMGVALRTIPAMSQQDKSQRPSPPGKAQCQLPGGKSITIDYSSPRMKGRKVYGELVPWDKPWRAGANEATTFVSDADVIVGGKTAPAGSYTIFVIPTAAKWTLIVHKKTGEWGIPYPGEAGELLRTDMKVSSLPGPLENFTIAFDQTSGGCTLRMDWETTRASVDITPKM
jgi:hypothetical protein